MAPKMGLCRAHFHFHSCSACLCEYLRANGKVNTNKYIFDAKLESRLKVSQQAIERTRNCFSTTLSALLRQLMFIECNNFSLDSPASSQSAPHFQHVSVFGVHLTLREGWIHSHMSTHSVRSNGVKYKWAAKYPNTFTCNQIYLLSFALTFG